MDTTIKLPEEFQKRFRTLLGDEYDSFEKAISSDRSFGLRLNPIKPVCLNEEHKKTFGILSSVPWADEGYYYDEKARPGKSIYHEAGAYYIQEPSAMSVVQILDPKPGERICDLCAAPGGKTTHIAGRLMGKGLLVSNEIITDRARILYRNVERMGISNCVVTNEDPRNLVPKFPGFFHRIVVDAPCSGEGMFRKDETAIEEWSVENVHNCAKRQEWILDCASMMVMPGGVIVYSTCTFEPDENENLIGNFLKKHPDWRVETTEVQKLLSPAKSEWMDAPNNELNKAVRIWPHKNDGEGHFIVKLVKSGTYAVESDKTLKKEKNIIERRKIEDYLREKVLKEDRFEIENREFISFGDMIYLLPMGITSASLKGIKVISPGLQCLEVKKDRYEPAHGLAMAINMNDSKYAYELCEADAIKYLRGEGVNIQLSENCDIPSGSFVLVMYDGLSIGFGKYVNGNIKNRYPKGLRRDLAL